VGILRTRARESAPPEKARLRLRAFLCLSICLAFLAAGCATPVGVKRVDPRTLHHDLTSNVLSTERLSGPSAIAFQRRGLDAAFRSAPDEALAQMNALAVATDDSDVLFALAEASFLHAENGGRRVHYRAAAIYAYAFLFPENEEKSPDPYDPRYRLACDLYNRGITSGFASDDGEEVVLQSAIYELPFGSLEVAFDRSSLRWADRRLDHFVPVAELEVRGLRNRYRKPGVGAPLAADGLLDDPEKEVSDFVPRGVKVPANAFLRIERPREQLASERLRATLELRVGFNASRTVAIGGRIVPLELETTTVLAYMLAESPIWKRELKGFLIGDLTREESRLVGLAPYRPGRIPVVLVHGTASSAGRWADMLNDLGNDRRIFKRYQFWFFSYDTGNPIAYSASLLRASLREAIERFDPDGADPALRELVLIGHSQGGLLVKMTAIDPGTRLWDSVSSVPLEELDVSDDTRELVRSAFFVEPLPSVRRVVFIATPQRGSFVAGKRIAHWIASFTKLPSRVGRASFDILTDNPGALRVPLLKRVPTSVDNMTPGHPFVVGLASLDVVPDVAAHSIIAVKGDGPVEEGNDGVVEYKSAHIEGVESELVVRSHHSVQGHPDTIEEVRRILLLHAGLD
jgi:pimeloyl-ACP methyl ester carboxylesterase